MKNKLYNKYEIQNSKISMNVSKSSFVCIAFIRNLGGKDVGVYEIKPDVLESLCGEIVATNKTLMDEVIESGNNVLASPEYIKFSFSKHLLEDINYLTTLSGKEIFKPRHAYMILRDMVEQVIEFIYLMKHPTLIDEFMGNKIDNNKIVANMPIKSIHKLGNERYTGGRKSVSEMAKDISEKSLSGKNLALYDVYQILSEECHNSYFFSNLDNLGEIENGGEKTALTEEQVQYLMIIIGRFMEAYRQ